MQVTMTLAVELAPKVSAKDWDTVRDELDTLTASDLDAFQLDMLADWVCQLKQEG